MQAIRLERPGSFAAITLEEPKDAGPDEALVRVHRVGICGTDISGFLGRMPFYSYPRIPGHELGVEVLAVGPGVTNVAIGDRCSVEPYLNCQTCFACRRGSGNCCETLQVLGVHIDGGLRPRFLVPARKLHRSQLLSFEQLALVETLAIGCHACTRGRPESSQHVLVVGAGPIGLSVIEFARLAGATITVLDVNERRLDFCKQKLGVTHVILGQDRVSVAEQFKVITSGTLFPLVFDATGSAASMSEALHYVAHTGRLVYVGITAEDVPVSDPLLHRREITLHATRNALPADFERIIGLIEHGRLDTRPWITHRTPFAQMIDVFPSLTNPATGVIKAIVEMK